MGNESPQRKPGADQAESKNRILDVAEHLFAEKGFAATSMRHIAQGAGVNVATLYYHCGSKDELFVSIYSRVVERMAVWVSQTFETGGSFRDIVASLIDRVVDFLGRHPSIPRLLLRSDLGDIPKADQAKREVYRPLYDMVAKVMEQQVERGEIRQIDPPSFVTAATGLINYLAMSLTKGQELGPDPDIDPGELERAQSTARMYILGALGLDP